mmetsp:Transcript_55860/g.130464  ORF Transcript_55860/g.130464 Transcript_55860/m.130464 type:complete len:387 (-) Transcript_55860:963-2123(-)
MALEVRWREPFEHELDLWNMDAIVGLEFEAFPQHGLCVWREPMWDHWRNAVHEPGLDLSHGRDVLIGQRATKHLNEATAQAPDVHLLGDQRTVAEALWCHVAGRATSVLPSEDRTMFTELLRLPEVANLDVEMGVQHQILRLQITVDQSRIALVHVPNGRCDLRGDLQPQGGLQVHSLHKQQVEKISVRKELGDDREVGMLQDAADVPDDGRMGQGPVRVDLALQVSKLLRGHRAVVPQNAPFHTDVLALPPGKVNFTKAALRDVLDKHEVLPLDDLLRHQLHNQLHISFHVPYFSGSDPLTLRIGGLLTSEGCCDNMRRKLAAVCRLLRNPMRRLCFGFRFRCRDHGIAARNHDGDGRLASWCAAAGRRASRESPRDALTGRARW